MTYELKSSTNMIAHTSIYIFFLFRYKDLNLLSLACVYNDYIVRYIGLHAFWVGTAIIVHIMTLGNKIII